LTRCLEQGWRRVAFVGVTKHAGKTTALNAFVRQAEARGLKVGLCSVGLDGERLDTILGVAKPPVYAPAGTVVVSAEKALESSDAGLEWLDILPVDSPLGQLVVCRVTRPGHVLLAGVRQRAHVEAVVPRLVGYGVDFALVDGAFDRIAAAAPGLVDAVVVAVGAVAGRTIDEVVNAAQPFLHRFRLPEADAAWKARLADAYEAGEIGWYVGGELHLSGRSGALSGVAAHPAWSADVEAVYVPGAVTDSVLGGLLAHPRPLLLVARHPAQVLLSRDSYQKWYRAGHRLCVWNSLPVAAVACNPHSITGYDLPKAELMEALQALAEPIPVYDPLDTGRDALDGATSTASAGL
jgi:hypothetical protein